MGKHGGALALQPPSLIPVTRLLCRGDNTYNQVGTGSTSATPALVGGSYNWTSATTGTRHTCGVTTSGNAYCFGTSSGYGTLGTGAATLQSGTPQSLSPANAGQWSTVRAGYYHTCGLKVDYTIMCWCVLGGAPLTCLPIPQHVLVVVGGC